MENVVAEGEVVASVVGVNLESAQEREEFDWESLGETGYFVLAKENKKTSLRVFKRKPDAVTAGAGLRKILKTPNHGLQHVVDFTLSTRISRVQNGIVWLFSSERTMRLKGGTKDLQHLHDQVRKVHLGMSKPAASVKQSLARRLSSRKSNPRPKGNNLALLSSRSVAGSTNAELQTLPIILSSKEYRDKFFEYLQFAFAQENLEFYEAVERYESISKEMVEERAELFAAIVNQFVEEGAEEQVNLPSHMSRALVDVLEGIRQGRVEIAQLKGDEFDQAKKEVFMLMERNFFHAFVVSTQEKETREKQVKEMSGTFVRVWQQGGLEGYMELMGQFEPDLERIVNMGRFFTTWTHMIDGQISEMQKLSSKFPLSRRVAGFGIPKERSFDRVLYQLFSGLSKLITILMELSRDLNLYIVAPTVSLSERVSESLESIKNTFRPALKEMNETRDALNAVVIKENDVFDAMQTIKRDNPGRKLTKKQEKLLGALEREQGTLDKKREKLELQVIAAENRNSDLMLNVCDMLESLSLHKLETERQILTQFALVQRTFHSKAEAAYQTLLFDCVDMDPIKQVVDIASSLLSGAKQKRAVSLRKVKPPVD